MFFHFPSFVLFNPIGQIFFWHHLDLNSGWLHQQKFFLKKKWAIPGLFYFNSSFQYTVDSNQMFNNFLPMTGFEPRTSGIGSDRSTNWATQPLPNDVKVCKNEDSSGFYLVDVRFSKVEK